MHGFDDGVPQRKRRRSRSTSRSFPANRAIWIPCWSITPSSNKDKGKHKVGIRVMLDTFIGANDGVPFTIPGKKGFVDTKAEFSQKEIPDYIEVIENPDDPEEPRHGGADGTAPQIARHRAGAHGEAAHLPLPRTNGPLGLEAGIRCKPTATRRRAIPAWPCTGLT